MVSFCLSIQKVYTLNGLVHQNETLGATFVLGMACSVHERPDRHRFASCPTISRLITHKSQAYLKLKCLTRVSPALLQYEMVMVPYLIPLQKCNNFCHFQFLFYERSNSNINSTEDIDGKPNMSAH